MQRHGITHADPRTAPDALRKAAAARTARKQLLEAIARGEQTIPAVLDWAKTDPIVGRTKVAALVKSHGGRLLIHSHKLSTSMPDKRKRAACYG